MTPLRRRGEKSKTLRLLELNKGWIILQICLLAKYFIFESPMVQSGRNVIIFVLGCTLTPHPPSHSRLVCRLVSSNDRANKVWNKIQPCCLHLTQSKIHHLTLYVTLPKTFSGTLFSHTCWNPAITQLNKWGVEYCSGVVAFTPGFPNTWGIPPFIVESVSLIRNRQIGVLLCSHNTHFQFCAVCLFRCSGPLTLWVLQLTSSLHGKKGGVWDVAFEWWVYNRKT